MTPTDRPDDIPDSPFANSPFKDNEGRPRLFVSGVWLQPREIQVEEMADDSGCGCLLAIVFIAAAVCLAAILGSGCTPRYTVIPADREAVPIRQTAPDAAASRRTYVEDPAAATGWYIPDAVMLQLMDAD